MSAFSGGTSEIEMLWIQISTSASAWLLRPGFLLSGGKACDPTGWWRAKLAVRPNARQSRSNVLADQDMIVFRFWNHQVCYELDSVLKAIWFALEKRLLSQPSPQSSPFRRDRRTLYGDDAISVARPANAKNCSSSELHRKEIPKILAAITDLSVTAFLSTCLHYPRLCVVHPVLDFND